MHAHPDLGLASLRTLDYNSNVCVVSGFYPSIDLRIMLLKRLESWCVGAASGRPVADTWEHVKCHSASHAPLARCTSVYGGQFPLQRQYPDPFMEDSNTKQLPQTVLVSRSGSYSGMAVSHSFWVFTATVIQNKRLIRSESTAHVRTEVRPCWRVEQMVTTLVKGGRHAYPVTGAYHACTD